MEGAESREILGSGFLELDVVADNADDVCLLLDRVCEIAGVGHVFSYQLSALSFGRSIAETGFSNEIVGYKVAELNIPDTELLWRSCGKLGFPFDERGKRGRRLITGTTTRFPGAYKNLRSRNIRYTIATGNPTTLL